MKKYLLVLSALLITVINIYSNSPRIAIIEESTNNSNRISAENHPDFYSMLNAYYDRCIPIVYHIKYPNPLDPMYLEDTVMNMYCTEYAYMFSSNAFSFNGNKEGEIYNARFLIEQDILNLYTQDSPYDIVINGRKHGDTVYVTTQVKSSINNANLKLRICIVEKQVTYPPSDTGANGETDFYYVARKMLPDNIGVDCSLQANQTRIFKNSFVFKNNWQKDQIFLVAFLQNPATREVMQSGYTISGLYDLQAVIDSSYLLTGINAELNYNFKMLNMREEPVIVKPYISVPESLIPSNWDVSLKPDTAVKLSSGWLKNAKLKVNPNGQTGFARIAVKLEPYSSFLYNDSTFYFYVATDSIKNIFVDIQENLQSHSLLNNINYTQNSAFVPYAVQDLNILNFMDYSTLILNYNMNEGIIIDTIIPDRLYVQLIENAISNEKNLLLFSENMLSIKQGKYDYVSMFFDSILNISNNGSPIQRFVEDDNGNVKSYLKFNVSGFAGESVLGDLKAVINDSKEAASFVHKTDLIKIQNNTDAISLLYYDDNEQNIAAVRKKNGDTKLIYSTFNFESIGSVLNKIKIWDRSLTWLNSKSEGIGALLFVDSDSLEFGQIDLGDSISKGFYLRNKGELPLVINKIDLGNNSENNFVIDAWDFPLSIATNDSKLLTITFYPKNDTLYLSKMYIYSNSQPDSVKEILLTGVGFTLDVVDDELNNIDNVYPNPAINEAVLKLGEYNTLQIVGETLTINLYDLKGELIKQNNARFNPNGEYHINLNGIAAGKYFIIIKTNSVSKCYPLILKR